MRLYEQSLLFLRIAQNINFEKVLVFGIKTDRIQAF
jgi:hypothetical protein